MPHKILRSVIYIMKKIQSTLLASSLIAALFFSTAYAATNTQDTNPHKMRDLVETYQSEKTDRIEDNKFTTMGNHRPMAMRRNGGPWRLLAELTGKDANAIRQDCRTNNKSPYAYAKENGVDVQFQAKQLAAVKKGLSQAVTNGKITQEKADSALERFSKFQKDEAAGKVMFPKGHGPGMMGNENRGMGYSRNMTKGSMPVDTLAELTGKNVDDLMTICRTSNKTCYDLAIENGVLDQYKERRIAANKEFLAKLVTEGKISQEKADEILAKVEKNISENKPERRHMVTGSRVPGPNRISPIEG